jgi:hypothetical protein
MNVAHIYGTTAVAFFGPVMTAGAIVGYAVHRKFASKEEVRRRDLLYVFLAVPSITNFLALLVGLGEMNEWWFNSRFLIMLSPLLILLLSILIKKMVEARSGNKTLLAYFITAVFLIYPIIVVPIYGEFVAFIDAKNSASYGTRPSAERWTKSQEELEGRFVKAYENSHYLIFVRGGLSG